MNKLKNEGGEEGKKMTRKRVLGPNNYLNLPPIFSIEIAWHFFNLKGFPKFSMMELGNSSNNTSLLNTHMMLGSFHMFS